MRNFRKTLSEKLETKRQELKKKLDEKREARKKRKEMERQFYEQAKQEVELSREKESIEKMKARAKAKAEAGGALGYYGGMLAGGIVKTSETFARRVKKTARNPKPLNRKKGRKGRRQAMQKEIMPTFDILGYTGKPLDILGKSGNQLDILGTGRKKKKMRLI